MKVTKAAVVLVEFQHQRTRPGLFHTLIASGLRRGRVLDNAETLVASARPGLK